MRIVLGSLFLETQKGSEESYITCTLVFYIACGVYVLTKLIYIREEDYTQQCALAFVWRGLYIMAFKYGKADVHRKPECMEPVVTFF